jgi:hypothetical protein
MLQVTTYLFQPNYIIDQNADEEVERMVAVNGAAFANGECILTRLDLPLTRLSDQFHDFILGGEWSLMADVHRAQIKAGLIGGEVRML